jgi:outer membrane protein TolC
MKRLLFIISTVFIANTALAQTLTLDECRQAAIDNNKQVAKSKVEQEKSDHTVSLYKTNFLPKFNIVAADLYSFGKGNFTIKGGHLPIYSYNEAAGKFVPDVTMNADGSYTLNQYADFPDKTMKLKVENVFTAGVMFEQPIYMGGKITAAYNMSKIGHRIAGLNIRKTESEVLVATDEAYTMVVRPKRW